MPRNLDPPLIFGSPSNQLVQAVIGFPINLLLLVFVLLALLGCAAPSTSPPLAAQCMDPTEGITDAQFAAMQTKIANELQNDTPAELYSSCRDAASLESGGSIGGIIAGKQCLLFLTSAMLKNRQEYDNGDHAYCRSDLDFKEFLGIISRYEAAGLGARLTTGTASTFDALFREFPCDPACRPNARPLAIEPTNVTRNTDRDSFAFQYKTTADLYRKCTTPESDNDHIPAMYACRGFIKAATQYHDFIIVKRPNLQRLICPHGNLSTDDAMRIFNEWVTKNSDNKKIMNELPVIGLIRALNKQYPCN